MRYLISLIATFFYLQLQSTSAGLSDSLTAGAFSMGTRNTISMFNHDNATGTGIGGQFRLQIFDRINSEWYADYITSRNELYTIRSDYHIGWSVMYYTGKNIQFEKLIQAYIIAGHCFDYSKVKDQVNSGNFADKLSMATQAGIGAHFNFTSKYDCSLSAQYMIHFGRQIEPSVSDEMVSIVKEEFSAPEGHLLFTVSFNYKFVDFW